MSKTASTKQLIELLQDFEDKHGPSVVSDIVVRNEPDRECEYVLFLSDIDRTYPIRVPSVEYETFWSKKEEE